MDCLALWASFWLCVVSSWCAPIPPARTYVAESQIWSKSSSFRTMLVTFLLLVRVTMAKTTYRRTSLRLTVPEGESMTIMQGASRQAGCWSNSFELKSLSASRKQREKWLEMAWAFETSKPPSGTPHHRATSQSLSTAPSAGNKYPHLRSWGRGRGLYLNHRDTSMLQLCLQLPRPPAPCAAFDLPLCFYCLLLLFNTQRNGFHYGIFTNSLFFYYPSSLFSSSHLFPPHTGSFYPAVAFLFSHQVYSVTLSPPLGLFPPPPHSPLSSFMIDTHMYTGRHI